MPNLRLGTGDEECEVSIKEAAEAVMKAMDYDGEMVVSFHSGYIESVFYLEKCRYLTAAEQLIFINERQLKSF